MKARVLFLALPALLAVGTAGLAEPRPLSIEEALSLSLENAEALRIKAQAVAKSRSRLAEARAKALPSISLEAAASYLTNPPEGITVTRGELGTLPPPVSLPLPDRDIVFLADAEHTYFSLTASLSQPVYTWGKLAAGIRLAALDVVGLRTELELQRRNVRRETQRAYAGALLARLSLPVLEEMRLALLDIVTDREHAFNEGLSTRQSLLEARAGLATAVRGLLEAREGELTALESLRLLTGLEGQELALTTPFRDAPGVLEEQDLLERTLARATELELARTRISQAQEKMRLERGGGLLRPDLSLNVSLEVTGQKPPWTAEDWADTWNWDLILSLGTRVKLFDGGEARGRIEGSRSDLAMAAYGAAQAEKLLRLGVRQAVQEARQAEGELAELESRLEAVAEQQRNARVSFENSIITREELHSALLTLDRVRLQRLAARQRLELALAELEWFAGPLP
jgi:HAE1 family hydrophobic/amphiphilic exporter-1